jgi:hypothetical protein
VAVGQQVIPRCQKRTDESGPRNAGRVPALIVLFGGPALNEASNSDSFLEAVWVRSASSTRDMAQDLGLEQHFESKEECQVFNFVVKLIAGKSTHCSGCIKLMD